MLKHINRFLHQLKVVISSHIRMVRAILYFVLNINVPGFSSSLNRFLQEFF